MTPPGRTRDGAQQRSGFVPEPPVCRGGMYTIIYPTHIQAHIVSHHADLYYKRTYLNI